MEEKKFEEAKNKVIGLQRQRQGIGTYQEKTVHAVFKHYYAPDVEMHEIPIGNFVADIYTGDEIIEIQTSQLNRMRDKLACFLAQYPVTVVHPIPYRKWLRWIDEETGECSSRHKSPVTGSVYRAFGELYKIKEYLRHENLRLCFPLVDMEEYRLLNGWSLDKKRGSERYDRIPVALAEEVWIRCREDYRQLVPCELEEPFTSGDFGKAARLRQKDAGVVLNILLHVDTVIRTGKKGHSYTYAVKENLK